MSGTEGTLSAADREAMYICTVRAIVSRASPKISRMCAATSSRRMTRPVLRTRSVSALFISSAV
jgi:hypothetical protein